MILVRTNWPDFASYAASLSKPARKNLKAVTKQYAGIIYSKSPTFPIEEVRSFMTLWEQQLIRGKNVQWAFPVEHIAELAAKGEIALFFARDKAGEAVGAHFIQRRQGYWECHPPMYDKVKHPSMAKFMWFALIRYAIEHAFEPLDMGGGSDIWRDMLKRRAEYPNGRYKWIFVPEKAKRDPDSEPNYWISRPRCELLLKD